MFQKNHSVYHEEKFLDKNKSPTEKKIQNPFFDKSFQKNFLENENYIFVTNHTPFFQKNTPICFYISVFLFEKKFYLKQTLFLKRKLPKNTFFRKMSGKKPLTKKPFYKKKKTFEK